MNGRSWERVKGTPGQTHPNPKLALYIDRMTERVNKLMTLHVLDEQGNETKELRYKTRRQARKAARA